MDKGNPAGNRVENCIDACIPERHIFDALRCPVGLEFARRHAPHLFVVRLEKVIEKTLAETVGDPVLEAFFGLVPAEELGDADFGSRPEVGGDTTNGFDDAEVLQRIGRLERVIEVFPVVKDAAHSGPHKEILIGKDFVPQIFDGLHLGEEAMAAEIKAPTIDFNGS